MSVERSRKQEGRRNQDGISSRKRKRRKKEGN